MTAQSLAVARSSQNWIDEAFLWTATSLSVLTIFATVPAPGEWPSSPPMRNRTAASAPPAPAPASAPEPQIPAPLIAFGLPVPGYPVVSPFGLRQLPWEEGGRLHKGVDIAAPAGLPILAAADGVVLRTGVDGGYGRFIEIGHAAGLSTLYGHLSAFKARPGQSLRQGDAIGLIGSTGSSTGSHLHFEVHDGAGQALNPEMFMGRAFATAADLPIRAARRLPRGVRVAFVSYIPPARQEEMLAREEAKTAEAAAGTPQALAPTPALAPAGMQVLAPYAGGRVEARIEASSLTTTGTATLQASSGSGASQAGSR